MADKELRGLLECVTRSGGNVKRNTARAALLLEYVSHLREVPRSDFLKVAELNNWLRVIDGFFKTWASPDADLDALVQAAGDQTRCQVVVEGIISSAGCLGVKLEPLDEDRWIVAYLKDVHGMLQDVRISDLTPMSPICTALQQLDRMVQVLRPNLSLDRDLFKKVQRIMEQIRRVPFHPHRPTCVGPCAFPWSIDYCDIDFETYTTGRKKGQWVKVGNGITSDILKARFGVMDVAVKEMRLHSDASREEVVRLLQEEMDVLARLSHPNIVPVIGGCSYTDEPDELYASILVEFMARTLEDDMFNDNPLSLPVILDVALQLACGIQYLQRYALRREIKPSNIGISSDGVLKLLEYRLARNKSPTCCVAAVETTGSVEWLAPEVLEGGEASEPSDVWCWAAVVLAGLTQRRPRSKSGGSNRTAEQGWVPRVPEKSAAGDKIPDPLRDILQQCLHKNPQVRPAIKECVLAIHSLTYKTEIPLNPHTVALRQLAAVRLPDERYISLSSLRGAPQTWTVLGTGAFGKVYRTVYEPIQDEVAVKELCAAGGDDPAAVQNRLNFQREIVNLHHIRVNQVLNFYGWTQEEDGRIFMVTEYCGKGTLKGVLERERAKSPQLSGREWAAMALEVGLNMAQALAFVHSLHFVHLDVAARNVLVTSWNQYKLSDLGLMTKENAPAPVISLPWSPPEALRCRAVERTATTQHDVWSFGVMVYEVLNKGRAPFEELRIRCASDLEWIDLVTATIIDGQKPHVPVCAVHDDTCAELWAKVVLPCRSMAPGKRPSMRDLIQGIQEIRESQCLDLDRSSSVANPEAAPAGTYGGVFVQASAQPACDGNATSQPVDGVYGGEVPAAPKTIETGSPGVIMVDSYGSSVGGIASPLECTPGASTVFTLRTDQTYVALRSSWGEGCGELDVHSKYSDGILHVPHRKLPMPEIVPLPNDKLVVTEQHMWELCDGMQHWESIEGKLWAAGTVNRAVSNARRLWLQQKGTCPAVMSVPLFLYTADFYHTTFWAAWNSESTRWEVVKDRAAIMQFESAFSGLRASGRGCTEVAIPEGLGMGIDATTGTLWLAAPQAPYEEECGLTRFELDRVPMLRFCNAVPGDPFLSPLHDSVWWEVPPSLSFPREANVTPLGQQDLPPPGLLEYIHSRPSGDEFEMSRLVNITGPAEETDEWRGLVGKEGILLDGGPRGMAKVASLEGTVHSVPEKSVAPSPRSTMQSWKVSCYAPSPELKKEMLDLKGKAAEEASRFWQKPIADDLWEGVKNVLEKAGEELQLLFCAKTGCKWEDKKSTPPLATDIINAFSIQTLTVTYKGNTRTFLLALTGEPYLVMSFAGGWKKEITRVFRLAHLYPTSLSTHVNRLLRSLHTCGGFARTEVIVSSKEKVDGIPVGGRYYQTNPKELVFVAENGRLSLTQLTKDQFRVRDEEGQSVRVEKKDVQFDAAVSNNIEVYKFVILLRNALNRLPRVSQRTFRGIPTTKLPQGDYDDCKVLTWPVFISSADQGLAQQFLQSADNRREAAIFSIAGEGCRDVTVFSRYGREREYLYPPGTMFQVKKSLSTDAATMLGRANLQYLELKEVSVTAAAKAMVRDLLLEAPVGNCHVERIVFKTLQALDSDGQLELSLKHPNDGATQHKWQYWICAADDEHFECPLPASTRWVDIPQHLTEAIDKWAACVMKRVEDEAPTRASPTDFCEHEKAVVIEASEVGCDDEDLICEVFETPEVTLKDYCVFSTETYFEGRPGVTDSFFVSITGLDHGADGGQLRAQLRRKHGRPSLAIGEYGAQFLAKILKLGVPVQRLCLQNNKLGPAGAACVLNSLRFNHHVTEVLLGEHDQDIPADLQDALQLRTLLHYAPHQLLDYIWDKKPRVVGQALWDVRLWDDLCPLAERGTGPARELLTSWSLTFSAGHPDALPEMHSVSLLVPRDRQGGSYLHLAAAADWVKLPWAPPDIPFITIKRLLRLGASIHDRDSKGMTPLHYGARNPSPYSPGLVKLLLSKGASIVAQDNILETPLHKASRSGSPLLVRTLLEEASGITPDTINLANRFGYTPFIFAGMNERFDSEDGVEVLKMLRDRGADINRSDRDGRSALHHAIGLGLCRVVMCLVQMGADVHTADVHGNHPLTMMASKRCFNSKEGVCTVLEVARLTDPMARGKEGLPVVIAARACLGEVLLAILESIPPEACHELTHEEKVILLDRSARHCHPDVTMAIIKKLPGVRGMVDRLDEHGVSVLHRAARNSHFESSEGIDVIRTLCNTETLNTPNESLRTPLWYAANAGHVQIALHLLDMGADVTICDKIGNNPLHEATNHPACLLAILRHLGKSPKLLEALQSRTHKRMTPLHLALWHEQCWMSHDGQEAIREMLLLGADVVTEGRTAAMVFLQRLVDRRLREFFPKDSAAVALRLLKAHGLPLDEDCRQRLSDLTSPDDAKDLAEAYDDGIPALLACWERRSLRYRCDTRNDDGPEDAFNLQRHRTPWDDSEPADDNDSDADK
eukprot:Sspe_Gene.17339::Locus_6147_Transcript_1_1_Confidence_1.000_Length_7878::g.17339::m.17339